jgi:peptide/nickel transport system permease protein
MYRYIATRLIIAIPTLFVVSLIIFVIMRILPGDPLVSFLGIELDQIQQITPEERKALLAELGMDKPWVEQYAVWMGGVLRGDMGESFLRGDSISAIIAKRGLLSAEIAVLAVLIAWIIGLPAGIIAAVKPNSILDGFTSTVTVFFLAIPGFWFALLIVVAGILWFGYKAPITNIPPWVDPWRNFQMVIGPAFVVGVGAAAFIARITRSAMFEVLQEDYIRTARAKGLVSRLVLVRHAFPNALISVVTVSGLLLAFSMGGAITVEIAFVVPGLGKTLSQAIIARDFLMVQNLTLVYAGVFILVNLLIDLTYGRLDPRIRLTD